MADQQAGFQEGLTSPADNQVLVIPSDSTDLSYTSRALWVGTPGDLVITPAAGGSDVTYTVQAGTILPIRVSRVKATGTTAGNIVSWY